MKKRIVGLVLSIVLACSSTSLVFAESYTSGEFSLIDDEFCKNKPQEAENASEAMESLEIEADMSEESKTADECLELEEVYAETDETLATGSVALRWPVPGHTTLSQGYHDGGAIDISDGSIGGAKVVAAIGGTVTNIWLCSTQHSGSYGDCNGFGTGLVILGDDGRYYKYAHMQAGSIPTSAYRTCRVEAGQTIGAVGTTGNSTGNHLHFGISTGSWYNESGINPASETYVYDSNISVNFGSDRCEWDTTNAFVYTKLSSSSSGSFTGAGLRVWDERGNLIASKSESTSISGTYMEIYYNIYNETGVSLQNGRRYYYQMYGIFNGSTYWTEKKNFMTNTVAPSEVSGLKAYTKGNKKVQLSWSAVSGATGYLIYARKNGKYAYCGMTSNTSFTDTEALNNQWNFYWVYSYRSNSDGIKTVGKCSKYVYAKGFCSTVTGLKATSVSGGVKLSWNKDSSATGYLIYGRVNGGSYGYVGMTSRKSFTDKKASKNTYSFYWVIPYKMNSQKTRVLGTVSNYVYGKSK